jgi:Asp/Glu/hydantoin racemase
MNIFQDIVNSEIFVNMAPTIKEATHVVGLQVTAMASSILAMHIFTEMNIEMALKIDTLDWSDQSKSQAKLALGAVELCLGGAAYCVAVSVLAPATFGLAIAGGVAGGLMMAGMVIIAAEMTSKEGLDFIKNL